MEYVWEECSYQQRCRRLAQPCQHPRTEVQLTVLPPDRTYVQEASKIPLQLKMISEGKLRRRQRKQTKMVQWKILQLWDDYANNKITASHLLKKCGSLYTPGV